MVTKKARALQERQEYLAGLRRAETLRESHRAELATRERKGRRSRRPKHLLRWRSPGVLGANAGAEV